MTHVRYTQNKIQIIKSGQCLTRTIFHSKGYRFRYRFVIVLIASAGCHFRGCYKRLQATKNMSLSMWEACIGWQASG